MNRRDFDDYKIKVQKDFQENQFPLLVATKAFGMGVNKTNIRYTMHYGIPGSMESLPRGRTSGARWKDCWCYVLLSKETIAREDLDKLFDLRLLWTW